MTVTNSVPARLHRDRERLAKAKHSTAARPSDECRRGFITPQNRRVPGPVNKVFGGTSQPARPSAAVRAAQLRAKAANMGISTSRAPTPAGAKSRLSGRRRKRADTAAKDEERRQKLAARDKRLFDMRSVRTVELIDKRSQPAERNDGAKEATAKAKPISAAHREHARTGTGPFAGISGW